MRLDEEPSEVSKRQPSSLSHRQPMLNPIPEPVVSAANELDNIDQLKSTTSQRQSFKYKVPVRLPEQQRQLDSYKIINSVDKKDTSPKPRAIRQQSYLFKLPHLYFIAMSILEITLMIVYGVYYGVQDKTQKQIGLGVLIIVTSLAEGLLFAYMVFLRNLIDVYWGLVWISFMVNFLFAAIGAASGVPYISLIASGILLLINGIGLSFIRGKWQTFFLVMALAFYLFIWGIFITSVIQGVNKIDPALITPEAVLVGFWILVVAYQLTCKRKWRNRTCNQKWEFIASFYLMTVVLCFGIAIGVPGEYTWLYLTQVVNLAYIGCTVYFVLVVIETGKAKINAIDRILNFIKKSKTDPNHIYQMSDSLLTTSIHHYKNPPKQLINKPLSKCISCLTEQSRFYYQNCKHAVIGHQCVLDWIKRGSNKCPLCRELSLCLVQVSVPELNNKKENGKYRKKEKSINNKQTVSNIICYQKHKMDRKTYLLSSLKKQVLNLKTQLDQMDQHKNIERSHNRSTTESCRFNSSVYDSSYLDRGVKKFPMQENCKNIADLIQEKSKVEKVPKICSFRKAELEKTKQNFSTEKQSLSTDRKYSPNPLTGQGYSDQKKGKKTSFPERPQKTQRKQSQRKHFNYSFK